MKKIIKYGLSILVGAIVIFNLSSPIFAGSDPETPPLLDKEYLD
ncbi:hypothetical protein [Dethiothermospora halolimnae]